MEVTGNTVKQKIADLHSVDREKVTMNALSWQILAPDHAAIVWYNTNGDKFNLPYAAVAIDDEVYINEREDAIKDASDIKHHSWLRLSARDGVDGSILDRQIHELQPEQEETISRGMHI